MTHRAQQPSSSEIDEFDQSTLKMQLLLCLSRDFEQQAFTKYFYEECGLREIETNQQYLVKSNNRVEIEETVRIRQGKGRAAESIGGGYVQVLTLHNAPQPWEEGGTGSDSTNKSDSEKE